MSLTFYYGSGSPFAWRVWLALEAKGVAYDQRIISFAERQHKAPEYLAVNPRGKIPAIVDDGFALYESAAIVEYLDERFPGTAPLFPGDIRQRARIRRLVQESDHAFGAAMDPLLSQVLFTAKEAWNDDAIAKSREKFGREAAFWEPLVHEPFLAGTEGPTAADFALYPHAALALRLDKRKPDLDVRSLFGPRFTAWMHRVEALPYFAKTIPPHWR